MDFINKNLSSGLKLLMGLIGILIFLRIIPWIAVIAVMFWGINRCIKGIKTYREKRQNKKTKQEKVYERSSMYKDESSFDFSEKKVVDVEYEEVSR